MRPMDPFVDRHRLTGCRKSAELWAWALPRYADTRQRRADGWSITASLMSAVTGLAIWPVVTTDPGVWATITVAVVALLSSAASVIPRVKSYAEAAGLARELSAEYGRLLGQFEALESTSKAHGLITDPAVLTLVADFQKTKVRKDSLPGLGDPHDLRMEFLRDQEELAAAEAQAEGRTTPAGVSSGVRAPRRDGLSPVAPPVLSPA